MGPQIRSLLVREVRASGVFVERQCKYQIVRRQQAELLLGWLLHSEPVKNSTCKPASGRITSRRVSTWARLLRLCVVCHDKAASLGAELERQRQAVCNIEVIKHATDIVHLRQRQRAG